MKDTMSTLKVGEGSWVPLSSVFTLAGEQRYNILVKREPVVRIHLSKGYASYVDKLYGNYTKIDDMGYDFHVREVIGNLAVVVPIAAPKYWHYANICDVEMYVDKDILAVILSGV